MSKPDITLIASDKSWIEGDALHQLEVTAALPGMVRAVGLPDLHPGKGIPIGAAFLCQNCLYPHLVGNDIGCGMGLWQTDMKAAKFKLDRSVKKLDGFEEPWDGDSADALVCKGLPADLWPYALGTIGSGNHFAEFQKVDRVIDCEAFEALSFNKASVYLLVHSGSRGLGESILRRHIDKHGASGLTSGDPALEKYVGAHDRAVTWAELNREIIAKRFLNALGAEGTRRLDICHNSVTPAPDMPGHWLHRKGAAPADKGLVIIPGSRGSLSYLVQPVPGTDDIALASLAHGAGRRWKRSEAKGRLSHRYSVSDLTQTPLGSRVICEDKALIYEEAPEAYKDIESVIDDLTNAGLITVLASLRPLITYKTRRR